jgi:hypothetical protein
MVHWTTSEAFMGRRLQISFMAFRMYDGRNGAVEFNEIERGMELKMESTDGYPDHVSSVESDDAVP